MAQGLNNQEECLLPGQWDLPEQKLDTSSPFLIPVGTAFVEKDMLGIAEEAWARFGVRIASCWCGRCLSVGHFPHMAVQLTVRGETVPVFGFKQFDARVLQRLHEIDTRRVNVAEGIQRKRTDAQAAQRQRVHDSNAERMDMVESALRSHKHTYSTPIGTTDVNITESKM